MRATESRRPISFRIAMVSPRLLTHFPHLVLCREEQYLSDDSFPDRLLHGGGVEATEQELDVTPDLGQVRVGGCRLRSAPPRG
jgi:hypothetical protein